MEKPYVISEELDIIDADYIQKNKIDEFRESLDDDLRSMGKNTTWVSSNELRQGMNNIIAKTRLPIASLDDRYVTSADGWIGMSRGVDGNLNDIGYLPRVGYLSIARQLDEIASIGDEIVVVDDVVFSGEMICKLKEELQKRNVKIGAVACGILIGEGAEKLQDAGINIEAVRVFDEVDDELCERDFAVVAGSGRRVKSPAVNALYICNEFGKPTEWASIPSPYVNEFAYNSYIRSKGLIKPDAEMQDIGRFYGFDSRGNARVTLGSRAFDARLF